ncbi:NAD-dependent epimerase/dehydratase family protein [Rhodobacteraceae bacterium 2CG4]|uniref:NAD-dependent epimerase/dehydratase family protein n=1 Tax=Halovulum marinum TaxID=2662447 RepID=A0A6L5Z3L2_9RHOB|nr:nucleoside-diphosphate sugar epimerase/dehydratase [Halovulum marinum]MSU90655.1 NAD-dependent epimerase/dehydratase family protein [Halovulum marinum]
MTRSQKAIVLLSLDGLAMLLALLVALQLRLGDPWPDQYFAQGYGLFALVPAFGMLISWMMGVPRIVLRSFEQRALFRLVEFAFIMSLVTAALNTGLQFGLPRSIPGIWAAVFLAFALFSRLVLLGLVERLNMLGSARKNVLIYGAGGTGQQLAAALRGSAEHNPVGFLDDNLALRRTEVSGLRVYPPSSLGQLVARYNIAQVILAMPSVRPVDRREKLRMLSNLGLEVLTLPSFNELLDGRHLAEQIRPVSPDELLGRAAVNLRGPEVTGAYAGRTVMISGAGGSIGSELTRQLLVAQPARVVLYEQNEFGLYEIEKELRAAGHRTEIVPVLGSVTDPLRVARTLGQHGVEIILHAAAYKHVPMVEANPLEGARNNILGTATVADAARAAGVQRFILVSTDKAVRPTNVMGATKRMAELVIQDRQTRGDGGTIFAMVRFGNVLGSSGSVIPLFREQIQAGGPVTLTHPDVTRYFMTIPEASQLVLLAGAFATGGDVFLLDMGQPIRIADLARSLIELSGLTVRDADNPGGDIEIRITGLRPGEKLYEEMLIGGATISTPHPKIRRAAEGRLSPEALDAALDGIAAAVRDGDAGRMLQVLRHAVPDYRPPLTLDGGIALPAG